MNAAFKKSLVCALMMCSIAVVMASKSFSSDQEHLEGAPAYAWSKIYNISPADPQGREGTQVLHFSANKYRPYEKNDYAQEFFDKYCRNAKALKTDADTLRFASDYAQLKASSDVQRFILEMGTGAAKTTNFLAALNPTQKIHTFESYEGIPMDWDKGADSRVIKQGSFALRDSGSTYLPPVLNNVRIHVGTFENVLPRFKDQILKNSPISLLNIDCDIYASTKTVFDILGDHIVPGTVIHFDELYNYANYQQGEFKALLEFVQERKYAFEVVAFNAVHEQVVVEIKKS